MYSEKLKPEHFGDGYGKEPLTLKYEVVKALRGRRVHDGSAESLDAMKRLLVEVGYTFKTYGSKVSAANFPFPGEQHCWSAITRLGHASGESKSASAAIYMAWQHAVETAIWFRHPNLSPAQIELVSPTYIKRHADMIFEALHPDSPVWRGIEAAEMREAKATYPQIAARFGISVGYCRSVVWYGRYVTAGRLKELSPLASIDLTEIALPVASATVYEPEAAEEFSPSP